MPESSVQLPPNSTGAKLRTETVVVGPDTVHQEVVTLADPTGQFADVAKLANLDIALSALRDALEAISVQNFPSDYPDAAAIAQLEAIRVLLAATLSVVGTVALDATTLAALENITVAIAAGQLVGLDATTLAALENIVVSGTVALDAPTLAALENITAVISGSVTVTATDLDTRPLSLLEDNVRQTVRPMTPLSVSRTGPLTGDVLVAVPGGSRMRLLRNAGHCDPATAIGTYPIIGLKLGALTVFADKLEAGLPWAETVCFEGADGADLTLDLTTSETVFLNMRYELF